MLVALKNARFAWKSSTIFRAIPSEILRGADWKNSRRPPPTFPVCIYIGKLLISPKKFYPPPVILIFFLRTPPLHFRDPPPPPTHTQFYFLFPVRLRWISNGIALMWEFDHVQLSIIMVCDSFRPCPSVCHPVTTSPAAANGPMDMTFGIKLVINDRRPHADFW